MNIRKLYEEAGIFDIQENGLYPIPGSGSQNPKVAFVFINPTHSNKSAHPEWYGPRFPFAGTKQVWKVFSDAGFFPKRLVEKMDEGWDEMLAEDVLSWMERKRIWMTNIVKRTEWSGDNPSAKEIRKWLPLLEKELEILNPRYIVSMGLLPLKYIAKGSAKLSEVYEDLLSNKVRKWRFRNSTVLLSYFPVGRGNPKRATEMLRVYWKMIK